MPGLDEDVAAAPTRTLQSLSTLLQWMATESQSLTQQQRNEALAVPLAIASKVSSRVVARGIRMLFASQPPNPGPDARPAVQAPPQAALAPKQPVATPVPAAALPAPLDDGETTPDGETVTVVTIEEEVVVPDEVLPPPTRVGAVAQ